MNKPKRPRIADVAQVAGVSEATVSVVLNNRVGENVRVSQATQQKIWDAVQQLGYVANPLAQSLAGGRNYIIAVFTFESIFPIDSRNFYYPFLIGIEEAAAEQGYDLLLITGSDHTPDGRRHIFQNGINRLNRADGAVLLGHGDKREINQLLAERYPFVYVGRRESPNDNMSYVAADYVAASGEVVEHLIKCGHRHIAYFRTALNTESSQDRETGFRMALEQHQLLVDHDCVWSGTPEQLSNDTFQQCIARGVSAIVAENNELGHKLLAAGNSQDLECPRDYSLAVLGNPLNPMIEAKDWTGFNIPRREMGREALRMLVELLTKSEDGITLPLRKTLDCIFDPGSTTRAV